MKVRQIKSLKRQAGFLLNPARFGSVLLPAVLWDAATKGSTNVTLTNGNLTAVMLAGKGCRTAVSKSAGKGYVEFYVDNKTAPQNLFCGLSKGSTFNGNDWTLAGNALYIFYENSTDTMNYYGGTSGGVGNGAPDITATTGGTFQLAIDHNAGTILVGYNNVYKAAIALTAMAGQEIHLCAFAPSTSTTANITLSLRAKASNQIYAPPAGYVPWESLA